MHYTCEMRQEKPSEVQSFTECTNDWRQVSGRRKGGKAKRTQPPPDPPDPRRLRERSRECRKYMEELFRVAKKEYEEDGNLDKYKKVEKCYFDTIAKLDMVDMKSGEF